ncbi:hypothetical protein CDL12_15863 [Handroanthus impetiginosus]|uniref:Uncharacterized protein n=1 Tax=Handroanthus impetiginosus TaxID=429701 RepID=A0A2G9H1Y3_9LAMI|nr:hypothetical protein CDL12_15863 [Handroanthus impetiginosus]
MQKNNEYVMDLLQGYTKWVAHIEMSQKRGFKSYPLRNLNAFDDMEGISYHALGIPNEAYVTKDTINAREEMFNEEARRFRNCLVELISFSKASYKMFESL